MCSAGEMFEEHLAVLPRAYPISFTHAGVFCSTWKQKGIQEGGWASRTVGGPFIISPPSSVSAPMRAAL